MILGITGGVGSGKSTVLNYLENKHHAFIIEADAVAKYIMEPGHIVYEKVLEAFPELKLDNNGFIDRAYFASIVFNDEDKLKLLNSIVHPGVKTEIKSLINKSQSENEHRLIVIEAALLIEDGYKAICDEIWYVYCEKENRIKRLMESRGYTREKSLEIMKNQMSEADFKKNTDAVIDNTNNEENTHKQIDELLDKM